MPPPPGKGVEAMKCAHRSYITPYVSGKWCACSPPILVASGDGRAVERRPTR